MTADFAFVDATGVLNLGVPTPSSISKTGSTRDKERSDVHGQARRGIECHSSTLVISVDIGGPRRPYRSGRSRKGNKAAILVAAPEYLEIFNAFRIVHKCFTYYATGQGNRSVCLRLLPKSTDRERREYKRTAVGSSVMTAGHHGKNETSVWI